MARNASRPTICSRRTSTARLRSARSPLSCRERWPPLPWFPRPPSLAGVHSRAQASLRTPSKSLRASNCAPASVRSPPTAGTNRRAAPRITPSSTAFCKPRRSSATPRSSTNRAKFLPNPRARLCLGRVGQRQDRGARRRRPLSRPARHARLPPRPDRALQHGRVHQEHRGLESEFHAWRAAASHCEGLAQQRATRYRHSHRHHLEPAHRAADRSGNLTHRGLRWMAWLPPDPL